MKILARHKVNKRKSSKQFKKHAKRTKVPNMRHAPQRGGYRF